MAAGQFQTDLTDLTTNDDGLRGSAPRLLVVHTFEGPDIPIERMMDYQSGRLPHQRTGSYHVVIGADGRTGRENDNEFIPWAAGWTGNRIGLHVSLMAQASLTRDEWMRRTAQLEALGRWLAHESRANAIPLQPAAIPDIQGQGRGVCSHADLSRAFPAETDHTDPGAHFPWAHVLKLAGGSDPRPAPAEPGIGGSWHVVQPGDTLTALSRTYGTSVKSIVSWNRIDDPDTIRVGRVLRVRPKQ